MLPVPGSLYGATLTLTTRILRGEVDLDAETQERLEEIRLKFQDVSDIVGRLSVDEPGSWAGFAGRLMDHCFETEGRCENPRLWRDRFGFTRGLHRLPNSLMMELFEKFDWREVPSSEGSDEILVARLPTGPYVCGIVDNYRSGLGDTDRYLFAREDGVELDDIERGLAQLFWRDRSAIILDSGPDGPTFSEFDGVDAGRKPEYHGELEDCFDRWQKYRREGIRRNVLLQGPPGCGKSTFCLHAARELTDRAVLLTPSFYDDVRCAHWQAIADAIRPELVIVDDVDRVNERSLQTKLKLFEETYCDIPYVLFTSNDADELPEPMKRPGRIDQIIEVEPPGRELRWELIRKMADRVGVDVPDDHLPRLDAIMQDQSNAHLLEALRRARIEGWNADPVPGDATFDPGEPDEAARDLEPEAAAT